MAHVLLSILLLVNVPALEFETDDGVTMIYDQRGTGDVTVVLVHCWACDRSFWKDQVDVLAKGYRVVTVDLAGHGASGSNRETWSIMALGADVADLVTHLKLDRFVLIGHSMGGPVALAAAPLCGDGLIGVVGVDTLHNADMNITQEMIDMMASGFRQDFKGAMAGFVGLMFKAESPAKAFVLERASAANADVALALIDSYVDLDFVALFQKARVPIRCINVEPGAPGTIATAIEANRKYADFDAELMPDVGHFLHMEQPEAFNQRLLPLLEALIKPK